MRLLEDAGREKHRILWWRNDETGTLRDSLEFKKEDSDAALRSSSPGLAGILYTSDALLCVLCAKQTLPNLTERDWL